MKTATNSSFTQERMPITSEEWCTLEMTLRPYIKNCLYRYRISRWAGYEQEIAEDVIQETYLRVLRFMSKDGEHANTSPIKNFEALCKTIAKRYVLDLYRKDRRVEGSLDDEEFSAARVIPLIVSDDPAELALEDMTLYSSMLTFSQIVKSFPEKQLEALLIDLAHKVEFDDECPTALERAMWTVGIQLRDYYRLLPQDPVLRGRHAALVCLAYQRLRLALTTESTNTELSLHERQTYPANSQGPHLARKKETLNNDRKEETTVIQKEELSFLDSLQELYQRAIQLRYIKGYSYSEIATQMELPVGTVKSHVSRGMKLLRGLVQQRETHNNTEIGQKQIGAITNLDKLEGPYKTAVQLHYLEGRSYPEVATVLHVPLNTAKSYVHRGMKVLCA